MVREKFRRLKGFIFANIFLALVTQSTQDGFRSVLVGGACVAHSECTSGHCDSGTCAEGVTCDPDNGIFGGDCDGEATGVCNGAANFCVECLTDSECNGQWCFRNVCVDCATDANCPSGTVCDPSCHVCRQCYEDDNCPESAPVCSADYRCVCSDDDSCSSGVCEDDVCIQCRDDNDCTQSVCMDGVCKECRDGADCASGICFGNVCTGFELGVLVPLFAGALLSGALVSLASVFLGVFPPLKPFEPDNHQGYNYSNDYTLKEQLTRQYFDAHEKYS